MTEYWVSQGNKWCDYCKIFISNNPVTIRTHEFGQRHKDNVAKKLATIRKETAAKEKEKQQAIKDLARIEARAKKSYQKDLAANQKAEESASEPKLQNSHGTNLKLDKNRVLPAEVLNQSVATTTVSSQNTASRTSEWTYDEASGYYVNTATGYYYDANSGLYYSNILGKWLTQEEAFKSSQEIPKDALPVSKRDICNEMAVTVVTSRVTGEPERKDSRKASGSAAPGFVLPASQTLGKRVKGRPSSLEVGKKQKIKKPDKITSEEKAALAAREAAKKRTEEREKALLGLYQSY